MKNILLNKTKKIIGVFLIALFTFNILPLNVFADIKSDLQSRSLIQDTVLDQKYSIVTQPSKGTVHNFTNVSMNSGGATMANNAVVDNTSGPSDSQGFSISGRYKYGDEFNGSEYRTPTITYTFTDYYVQYNKAVKDTITGKEYNARMYIKNASITINEASCERSAWAWKHATTEDWKVHIGFYGTNGGSTDGRANGMGIYFHPVEGNVGKYLGNNKINITLEYKLYNTDGTEVTSAVPGIAGITDIDAQQIFSFNNMNNNVTSGDPASHIYLSFRETLNYLGDEGMSYSNNRFYSTSNSEGQNGSGENTEIGHYYFVLDDARTTNITFGMKGNIGAGSGLVFLNSTNSSYIKQKFNVNTSTSNGDSITPSITDIDEDGNVTIEYSSTNKAFSSVTIDGTTITAKQIEDAGGTYTFTSLGDSISVTKTKTIINKIKSNHTVSANFEKPKYNIDYKLHGGVLPTGAATEYTEGEGLALPKPTRTGYTFDGWYTEEVGGTKVDSITATDTGNKTLHAHWTANEYKFTVQYCYEDVTEGKGCVVRDVPVSPLYNDPSNYKATYGEKVNINQINSNNIAANVIEGFTYSAQDSIIEITISDKESENIIKIVYNRENRKVRFNNNNGTTDEQNIKYGRTVTKPSNPQKFGYEFDKWVYADGENKGKEFDFNTGITDNTNLEATYKLIDYEIDYNLKDGEKNDPLNPKTANVKTNVVLKDATKAGYDFVGWTYKNDKGEPVIISNNTLTEDIIKASLKDGKISIEPSFVPKGDTPYSVKYKLEKVDGGYDIIPTPQRSGVTDAKVKASDLNIKMDGFTLTNPDEEITITADGKAELVLVFDRNKVNVIYDANGGKFSDGSTTVTKQGVYEGNYPQVDNEPTRVGYVFAGWESDSDIPTDKIPLLDNGSSITLKAKWNSGPSSYKVITYKEKIDGTYESETVTVDALTGDKITLGDKGYPGFTLDTEKGVLQGVVDAEGKLVLEAYYKRDTKKVTFKIDEEDESKDENRDVKYEGKVDEDKIPDIPEKQGYTPAGWVDEDGKIFNFDDEIKDDIILRPHYTPNDDTPYKVIIHKMKDKDNYTTEEQTLFGTTDSEVEANVESLKGFKVNEKKSILKGKISPDGSLVLEVFYDIYNPDVVRTGDIISYVVIIILVVVSLNVFALLRKKKLRNNV